MFHFLSISNLNTSKGTFVLLDSAELLAQQITGFHVHFVGAPTAEISAERMQHEIESRGLHSVVTYHGWLYGEDKEASLAEADCFVHPTLDDCFPLVILEAMRHALPIIATPVGAIPDMLMNGETGIVVPENDAWSLAVAMAELMKNPGKAFQYGRTGQEVALGQFSSAVFEERLSLILSES